MRECLYNSSLHGKRRLDSEKPHFLCASHSAREIGTPPITSSAIMLKFIL